MADRNIPSNLRTPRELIVALTACVESYVDQQRYASLLRSIECRMENEDADGAAVGRTTFQVRNGPTSMPCDHCSQGVSDHLCPAVETTADGEFYGLWQRLADDMNGGKWEGLRREMSEWLKCRGIELPVTAASDVPTDGQLLDQLQDAFYKADSGYVEQDIELRKSLATLLVRYNRERPAVKTSPEHGSNCASRKTDPYEHPYACDCGAVP